MELGIFKLGISFNRRRGGRFSGNGFLHLANDEAKLSPDIPRGLLSPTSSAVGIINPARDLHS